MSKNADHCKAKVECDTLILDDLSSSDTIPTNIISNNTSTIEHEATVSKISEEQLFYLESRGISRQVAEAMFVSASLEQAAIDAPNEAAQTAVLRLGEKLVPGFGELFG